MIVTSTAWRIFGPDMSTCFYRFLGSDKSDGFRDKIILPLGTVFTNCTSLCVLVNYISLLMILKGRSQLTIINNGYLHRWQHCDIWHVCFNVWECFHSSFPLNSTAGIFYFSSVPVLALHAVGQNVIIWCVSTPLHWKKLYCTSVPYTGQRAEMKMWYYSCWTWWNSPKSDIFDYGKKFNPNKTNKISLVLYHQIF